MKAAAAALAGLAAVLLATAAAADTLPPPKLVPLGGPAKGLTVLVSSHRAGAKDVTLTLGYPAMLQCGRPRAKAAVHLPLAAAVPAKIAAAAVKMNGRRVGSALVHRNVLSVTAPKVTGMLCNSLTLGRVTLVVGAAAHLANPAKAGTYKVTVVSGGSTLTGTYTVS